MSLRSRSRKMPQVNIDSARLQDAQEKVSKGARQAAERVGPTTRQARKIAAKQMKTARYLSAPKIEQAGQYIEEEVGPRVGAMLQRTAGRVEPPKESRGRRGFAAMLLIVGGAVGAAGAIVTRRNAARSAEEPTSPDHLSAVSENSSTERAHTNNS
jgi:hypothetical protein